jgi:hypothetical protein
MVIFDNYKKVLSAFRNSNGNKTVYILAVLKMDEIVDKWSIIVSIDWITQENRGEVFSSFIKSLQDNLGKEELNEIARIGFYTPDEHLVQLFFKTFEEGQHIKEGCKVNGNIIHEGYIISLDKNKFNSEIAL